VVRVENLSLICSIMPDLLRGAWVHSSSGLASVLLASQTCSSPCALCLGKRNAAHDECAAGIGQEAHVVHVRDAHSVGVWGGEQRVQGQVIGRAALSASLNTGMWSAHQSLVITWRLFHLLPPCLGYLSVLFRSTSTCYWLHPLGPINHAHGCRGPPNIALSPSASPLNMPSALAPPEVLTKYLGARAPGKGGKATRNTGACDKQQIQGT
jgi:hypothetical protein